MLRNELNIRQSFQQLRCVQLNHRPSTQRHEPIKRRVSSSVSRFILRNENEINFLRRKRSPETKEHEIAWSQNSEAVRQGRIVGYRTAVQTPVFSVVIGDRPTPITGRRIWRRSSWTIYSSEDRPSRTHQHQRLRIELINKHIRVEIYALLPMVAISSVSKMHFKERLGLSLPTASALSVPPSNHPCVLGDECVASAARSQPICSRHPQLPLNDAVQRTALFRRTTDRRVSRLHDFLAANPGARRHGAAIRSAMPMIFLTPQAPSEQSQFLAHRTERTFGPSSSDRPAIWKERL